MPSLRPLSVLLGDYSVTRALLGGRVPSPDVRLEFADVPIIANEFKRVVREQAFDFAELAIVTFLIAKEHGVPLVLVPAVVLGRFQHSYLVYNSERGPLTPGDLTGKRVGVRSYSVTTGMWVRGILANDWDVDLDQVTWVTFDDPHVAEFRDPPNVQRAPRGEQMMGMLLAGQLDAAIISGRERPDPRIVPLIPDPDEAARAWHEQHGAIQVNHIMTVKASLAQSAPKIVQEVYRMLTVSKQAAGQPADGLDTTPFGPAAVRRHLQVAIEETYLQGLISRPFTVDELYDDVTRAL